MPPQLPLMMDATRDPPQLVPGVRSPPSKALGTLPTTLQHAGLADPGPVAAALWTDKELEAGVTLDAVVTVVDASRIDRQLATAPLVSAANEAEQQIAHADVVLLNKVRPVPAARNGHEALNVGVHGCETNLVLNSICAPREIAHA